MVTMFDMQNKQTLLKLAGIGGSSIGGFLYTLYQVPYYLVLGLPTFFGLYALLVFVMLTDFSYRILMD